MRLNRAALSLGGIVSEGTAAGRGACAVHRANFEEIATDCFFGGPDVGGSLFEHIST